MNGIQWSEMENCGEKWSGVVLDMEWIWGRYGEIEYS